ncbi:hypothetical protein NCCNTM_26850 [Mycolicibacterium sp. NCC-Tsukiji]|nr:hypothetical protein NCCNTM_26850 [Mycolicibacterium sp. NCC-Tsukiji]
MASRPTTCDIRVAIRAIVVVTGVPSTAADAFRCKTFGVTHNIHIRTVDSSIQYPNALSYGEKDQILWVQIGDHADSSDTIYFSPSYWQQYTVDPHSEDPLDLEFDEDDEDEDDDE